MGGPDDLINFRLLGSLTVRSGGVAVPVRAAKQRMILAALLLNANHEVSLDGLIYSLWEERPPDSAKVTLQNYVRRLRLMIGDTEHTRIRTSPVGYSITVDTSELDISSFEALQRRAKESARRQAWEQAVDLLATAKSLWRGRALSDIPANHMFTGEARRLEEMRLHATEDWIDASLNLGRHTEVIAELEQLANENPLRERLHALLMVSLYRDGRQVDALQAYQRARGTLIGEFGLEPGPDLHRIHQQILAGDSSLLLEVEADVKPDINGSHSRQINSIPPLPRQLPAAPFDFVGRQSELQTLSGLLDRVIEADDVGIAVISGSAGIGKTALAVHFGRKAADRFQDGQLYIDLRGFGSASRPVTPANGIRRFLDALTVPPDRIPASPDAQADLYRSIMARKQMLVVLDNARDEGHVRPFLPGGAGSLVVVTGRSRLTGLVATEGACLIAVDALSEQEAVDLTVSRLGADSIADGGALLRDLTSLCGRLPLALVIATARAKTDDGESLASLTAGLRDTRSRLSLLDTGDAAASVRASFDWSYRHLAPATAQMFRLLSVHGGPDISATAAASLAGAELQETQRYLDVLAGANLLTEHYPGRFAVHDLLRLFSAERAEVTDSKAVRRMAIERLLDYYLHTAWAANRLMNPARDPISLPPPVTGALAEQLADPPQSLSWFKAEHSGLLAAVTLAAEAGFNAHAWQIPWTFVDYLERQGHWEDWVATQRIALAATIRLGDRLAQARSHRGLGFACARRGSYREAQGHLGRALTLFRAVGDKVGEARTHQDLSWLLDRQGRLKQALAHEHRALALFKETGHTRGRATALNSIGWLCTQSGDHAAALDRCLEALDLHRVLGNHRGEAATWDSLGYARHHLHQHAEAIACYQRSLELFRELGDRYSQTEILTHLGDTYRADGRIGEAREAWLQALRLLEELQHPDVDQVRIKVQSLGEIAARGEHNGDRSDPMGFSRVPEWPG